MNKNEFDEAVWAATDLTSSQALVALAWATRCDYKTGGSVKQSFQTVADKAKVSRRQCMRLTQQLVDLGYLTEVDKQAGRPTVYALTLPTSDTHVTSDTHDTSCDEEQLVTNEAPTSDTHDTSSDQLVTNGTPTSDTGVTQYYKESTNTTTKEQSTGAPVAREEVQESSTSSYLDITSIPQSSLIQDTEAGTASIEDEEEEIEAIWTDEEMQKEIERKAILEEKLMMGTERTLSTVEAAIEAYRASQGHVLTARDVSEAVRFMERKGWEAKRAVEHVVDCRDNPW